MIAVRKSEDRGAFDFGWLDTKHTFSFGHYVDRKHMGFRTLRVINEDKVAPGQGFGRHPHADMEIISYVLQGQLAHGDSIGNARTIKPGEVQVMTAGSGVEHQEFNPSTTEQAHFLQIWLLPATRNARPSYDQKYFEPHTRADALKLIVSGDGRQGSLAINQDASLYASLLSGGKSVSHRFAPGRHGWVQVARGSVSVNGTALGPGDGAAISDETEVTLAASTDSEFLLFDLS